MEYMIGVGLALAVCTFARISGYDRERVFYPAVVIVVASYYILFAVIGSSGPVIALESLIAMAFLALGLVGFKKNLWLTVAALAGHGVFDAVHHLFIQNSGVPHWWPGFCLSFDILAGGILAVLLMRKPGFASPIPTPL